MVHTSTRSADESIGSEIALPFSPSTIPPRPNNSCPFAFSSLYNKPSAYSPIFTRITIMASFARTGRKIVAIGRNYQAHIKELSNATPTEPFFFLKPTTSYLPSSSRLELPRGIIAHHEVELGIVVGKRGRDVSEEEAMDYVSGYGASLFLHSSTC